MSDLSAAKLELVLLADDLSGACDSAAAFAERGLRTEVGLGAKSGPSARTDVWCRSSETRDVEPEALKEKLADELLSLPPAQRLFKKIDSVFRGNTFEEIACLLGLRPQMPAVLAAAFPAAGRVTRGGVLEINDISGSRSVDVVGQLRRRGNPVANVPAGLHEAEMKERVREHWRAGFRLVHCDAGRQEDLEAVVRAVGSLEPEGQHVLWMGSAGLARAIAASLPEMSSGASPSSPRPQGGEVLFFIGSDHPVTLEQVIALREHSRDAAHLHVVSVERGPRGVAAVQHRAKRYDASAIACIFVTGGDTATLVCQALEIESLRVLGEFAPGLPECEAVGGRFEGVRMILKSGGFGSREVLCAIAEEFGRVEVRSTDRQRGAATEQRTRQ